LLMFNLQFKLVPFKCIARKLKHGSSSFITLTLPLLYVNTSTFMLGIYGNPVQVAYFDCAYKVSNGFISINQILTSVFYPWVSRQAEKFSFIASVLICVGLAMSVISFSLSSLVVNLIFGEKMLGSIIALKIMSLSPLFIAIRSAFGVNYLLARGKDKLYMSIAAISSIVSFLGGIIIIYLYSSVGAAIVVVVAQGMYSLASMFFALKLMKKQDH
jgi:PST family polysaccharide transporter